MNSTSTFSYTHANKRDNYILIDCRLNIGMFPIVFPVRCASDARILPPAHITSGEVCRRIASQSRGRSDTFQQPSSLDKQSMDFAEALFTRSSFGVFFFDPSAPFASRLRLCASLRLDYTQPHACTLSLSLSSLSSTHRRNIPSLDGAEH